MKKLRIVFLVLLAVGNAVLFMSLTSAPAVAAFGSVDACDEESVEGCDCGRETTLSPAGCYPNLGQIHVCMDGVACDTPH